MSTPQFSDWSDSFGKIDVEAVINDIFSSVKAPPRSSVQVNVQTALDKFNAKVGIWRTKERVIPSTLFRILVQGHLKRRGVGLVKRYFLAGLACEGVNAMLYPEDYAVYRKALAELGYDLKQALLS